MKRLFLIYFWIVTALSATAENDVLPEDVFEFAFAQTKTFLLRHSNESDANQILSVLAKFPDLKKNSAIGVDPEEQNSRVRLEFRAGVGIPRSLLIVGSRFADDFYQRPEVMKGLLVREVTKAVEGTANNFIPILSSFTDFQIRALANEAKYYRLLRRFTKIDDKMITSMAAAIDKGENSDDWFDYLSERYQQDMRVLERFHKFMRPRLGKMTLADNIDAFSKLMSPLADEVIQRAEAAIATYWVDKDAGLRDLKRSYLGLRSYQYMASRYAKGIITNGLSSRELETKFSEWAAKAIVVDRLRDELSKLDAIQVASPAPVPIVDEQTIQLRKAEVRDWFKKEKK